jgi:magnesium chelatase family protein
LLSKVLSSATYGIEAYLVEVETHVEKQVPGFIIVGLPDNAVKESRERVIAAIKNSGIQFPVKKITINLAPADIKKEGSAFDLPIAVGILSALELIPLESLNDTIFLGELSLDGSLRHIKGALPIAVEAKSKSIKRVVLSSDSAQEAAIVDGIEVYGFENLSEVVSFLNGDLEKETTITDKQNLFSAIKCEKSFGSCCGRCP